MDKRRKDTGSVRSRLETVAGAATAGASCDDGELGCDKEDISFLCGPGDGAASGRPSKGTDPAEGTAPSNDKTGGPGTRKGKRAAMQKILNGMKNSIMRMTMHAGNNIILQEVL